MEDAAAAAVVATPQAGPTAAVLPAAVPPHSPRRGGPDLDAVRAEISRLREELGDAVPSPKKTPPRSRQSHASAGDTSEAAESASPFRRLFYGLGNKVATLPGIRLACPRASLRRCY